MRLLALPLDLCAGSARAAEPQPLSFAAGGETDVFYVQAVTACDRGCITWPCHPKTGERPAQ